MQGNNILNRVLFFIKKNRYLFFLILLYIIIIISIRPFGNFPLNDDWAYAWSVEKLFTEGRLKISDWSSPSLVFQVLWGFIFVKLFGFSFFVLRLSVIALNIIGLYCFFLLINEIVQHERLSFFVVCTLIFNPIYFNLTFTFMTDIPFMALTLISFLFYFKFTYEEKYIYLLIGSIFSSFSLLIRQIGIAVPVGILVYLIFKKKATKKNIFCSIAPPILVFCIYLFWFRYIHLSNWSNQVKVFASTMDHISDFDVLMGDFLHILIRSIIYWGLCACPVSMGLLANANLFNNKKCKIRLSHANIIAILILAFFLIFFVISKGPLPYFDNIFNKYGLGPITITNPNYKTSLFFGKKAFWYLLTFLGIFSFLFTSAAFISNKEDYHKISIILFPTSMLFIFSILKVGYLDRYTIMIYPAMLLICSILVRKINPSRASMATLFLLFFLISFLGTCDYFRWNEAKWDLGNSVKGYGIELSEVFNGFDWNAYYSYEKNMEKLKISKKIVEISEWEWADIQTFKALVSFSNNEFDREHLLDKVSYRTPFSIKKQFIYLWTF